MGMKLNEYQARAYGTSLDTQIAGSGLLYPVLGLVGEAGELANKVKKIYRDKGGVLTETDKVTLADEAGDCMWYVAEIITQLGYALDDVCYTNLGKLASRANRGVISGSGDER